MSKKCIPTEIVCILDRSGSMSFIKDDVIGGFNSFVKEQQKLGDDATMTLILFDNNYDVVYSDKNIDCVKKLTDDTYVPRGTTALYDAVGRAINEVKSRMKCGKPGRVLFSIITDGYENASREYNKCQITNLIKECKCKYDWEFIYLSASLTAFKDSDAIGIGKSQTFQFSQTSNGYRGMTALYGSAASSYRCGNSISFNKNT